METQTLSLKMSSFSSSIPHFIPSHLNFPNPNPNFARLRFNRSQFPLSNSLSCSASQQAASCSAGDRHRQLSSLESLFCYDKAIPEQIIEKPVGLSIAEKEIGDQPGCADCQAKGAVLCTTCSGSGLYVDSIMESQGIIVKVRCLSCGGTGNIMCSECGGRGHL